MTNWIKDWLQRRKAQRELKRKSKENLRTLSQLAQQHRTIVTLQKAGLLAWNQRDRQLLISAPLAVLFMNSAERWTGFIQTLTLYEQYRLQSAAWAEYIQKEELKAVRRAMEDGRSKMEDGKTPTISHQPSALSREDVERIRRARRAEISQTDMEPPVIKEFDFFIIPETTEAHPEPIAVGHYNAQTGEMEMETWERVRSLLVDSAAK
jgi:hypothetical protein